MPTTLLPWIPHGVCVLSVSSTVQYSTVLYNIIHYSTISYITLQYNMVLYSYRADPGGHSGHVPPLSQDLFSPALNLASLCMRVRRSARAAAHTWVGGGTRLQSALESISEGQNVKKFPGGHASRSHRGHTMHAISC